MVFFRKRSIVGCGLILSAAASPLTATALARGGMESGGGKIVGDDHNPWFLSLSQDQPVRYCLQQGPEFRQEDAELQDLVEQALAFWTTEFASGSALYTQEAAAETAGQPLVRVKTDGFHREACGDHTDLAIQFGVLTKEQRDGYFTKVQGTGEQWSSQPADFVAVTIRTAYDPVRLRGKGFMYISPDIGPERLHGEGVLSLPWHGILGGTRLGLALVHEFGHVFGLQHQGSRRQLMSATFLETLVSTPNGVPFPLTFFAPRTNDAIFDDCLLAGDALNKLRDFFHLATSDSCLKIAFAADSGLAVTAASAPAGEQRRVGKISFDGAGQRRYLPAIELWLPAVQQVFQGVPPAVKVLYGKQIVQAQYTGHYQSELSDATTPVFLQIDAQHVQLGGLVAGHIDPDLLPQVYGPYLSGWHPSPPTRNARSYDQLIR